MQVRSIKIETVGVEKESSWLSHEVRCTLKRRCVKTKLTLVRHAGKGGLNATLACSASTTLREKVTRLRQREKGDRAAKVG